MAPSSQDQEPPGNSARFNQVADPVASVMADGAYDRESVYAGVAEVDVGVHALNRMLEFGRPNYVRVA